MATKPVEGLAKLREPFPPNQISKLPKPTKAQTEAVKADFKKGIRCKVCESWHHPDVIHLDYVGHAALTDRLLDTDPEWNWEPMGLNPDGTPALDRVGGLWIKLTVCGVTRPGYGCADGKSGGDAMKEIIGDALRNAAMRFGAALDLWHKGDLHADEEEVSASAAPPAAPATAMISDDQRDQIMALAPAAGKDVRGICEAYKIGSLKELTAKQAKALIARLQEPAPAKPDPVPNPQYSENLADMVPY